MLVVKEHSDPGYRQRTIENARGATLTIAVAVDFTTAGERLTRQAAGDRYLAIHYPMDIAEASQRIADALRALAGDSEAPSLNIAGNGIYTLTKHGVTQVTANCAMYQLVRAVHQKVPLSCIRTGGQTGMDTAGLVAALALGIPAYGLYPQGFRVRDARGVDRIGTSQQVTDWLTGMAVSLPFDSLVT